MNRFKKRDEKVFIGSACAFTVIELVFVLVILGVLVSVALPKLENLRESADIAKGRADIAAIRAAIANHRQKNALRGENSYIDASDLDGSGLFDGVLMYPIPNSKTNGHWYTPTKGDGFYSFIVNSTSVIFTYNASNGTFTCDRSGELCKKLVY